MRESGKEISHNENEVLVESVSEQPPINRYELSTHESADPSVSVSPELQTSTSHQPAGLASTRPAGQPAIEILTALVLILALMGWIQFGGAAILDNDGYYHIRWAAMLRENWPHLPAFKNLPLTTLNEQNYVDHHYLFHVLLIPFTLGDLRVGAKLAAIVFSSIGMVSLFALLVAWRVQYRWLWLAPLVAGSEHFLYRMSMTRAPALSLALLGAGTYLILKRKHIWLGVLSFIFVWSYSLFPLIFAFTLVYSITVYLCERRFDFRGAVASLIGIIAGLVINPYFPKNLALLREHLLMKYSSEYPVAVGVEWDPYDSWAMLGISAVAFIVFLVGLVAFEYRRRKLDLKPLFFLIVSVMLLIMTFKARRFIEYWPPFAVLFAAFTISPRLESVNFAWLARTRDRVIAAIAAAVVTAAAILWMGWCVWTSRGDVKSETDPNTYRGASEWIATNVPAGSMIFNTNWDAFPALFYYNPNYAYVSGLDPTYLYNRDRPLWEVYESINNSEEENGARVIKERFGADYVVTGNGDSDFLTNAKDNENFEVVFEDKFAVVLRVRNPQSGSSKSGEQEQYDCHVGTTLVVFFVYC
jgi:hypothetical protein